MLALEGWRDGRPDMDTANALAHGYKALKQKHETTPSESARELANRVIELVYPETGGCLATNVAKAAAMIESSWDRVKRECADRAILNWYNECGTRADELRAAILDQPKEDKHE